MRRKFFNIPRLHTNFRLIESIQQPSAGEFGNRLSRPGSPARPHWNRPRDLVVHEPRPSAVPILCPARQTCFCGRLRSLMIALSSACCSVVTRCPTPSGTAPLRHGELASTGCDRVKRSGLDRDDVHIATSARVRLLRMTSAEQFVRSGVGDLLVDASPGWYRTFRAASCL